METELALLHAARKMDKDALIKIFDLYASPLYNYAMRLCRDSSLADHIVGDVFAKLLEQLASGKGPTTNLRAYLYEMTRHRMIDEARYSKRRVPLEVVHSFRSHGRSELPEAEERILLEQVLAALQHDLTEDQRHVIILRFLEGFSLDETAAIVGKEIGHVRVIQSRAIAKLRKVFAHRDLPAARQPGYSPLRESQAAKGSRL